MSREKTIENYDEEEGLHCKCPSDSPHQCPFRSDIKNDESECSCCESCTQSCWMDR